MSTLLLVPLLAFQVQQADHYGLITVDGRDTVAVERVTRRPGALVSEILVPNRARLSVVSTLDADGCVTGILEDVFPWGSAADATPLQHARVWLDGDSVRIDVRAGDVARTVARPAPGVSFLLAEEAMGSATQIVECALARGDSVDLAVVANPGVRLLNVPVRRHGDRVTVVTSDTARVQLGPDGRPARVEVGRGGRVVVRVPVETLPEVAAPAPDYGAPAGASYSAEAVAIPAPGSATLAGTLTLPREARAPLPAVVLVSGSGPQDRDSYAPIGGGWRPFRELADALSSRGVAVLRYDDRGVGASTGDFASGTELTEAEDVKAAVAFLRARKDVAADRIVVLGHSEGARVAMLVGAQDPALAGLVLMAGAADPRAAVRAQTLWSLEHARGAESLSRDSVLALVDRQMDSLAAAGRREVFRWDAAGLARRIAAPVAIFQGATDRQVPAEQAEALADVFRRAGNRDVTVRVFAGVNHLFVPDETGDFLRYGELPSGHLAPDVLRAVTDWITARPGAVAPSG
ncbi:MAG: alpha/beta hydrolase [Gemmatimonadetes bacterium]|nr:alpha/beta hydrolase [Gemmatimonadota bacterium]